MADPAMKSFYESEVKRIAASFVTTAFLGSKVDTFANLIRASVTADARKPFSNAEFETALTGLTGIASVRAANVAAQVQ